MTTTKTASAAKLTEMFTRSVSLSLEEEDLLRCMFELAYTEGERNGIELARTALQPSIEGLLQELAPHVRN